METLQQNLFQQIKNRLPPHLSLVDEVADLLNISNDSAYRRIRGEKPITFEELQKLAANFNISVDQILKLKSDTGTYSSKYVDAENFDFKSYLDDIVKNLKFISSFKNKEITFFSKDIPIFHYFTYPELAAFKYFFYMKTLLKASNLANIPFHVDAFLQPIIDASNAIISAYNTIPSIEIMSIENINTTLRQIEYYKETYQFKSSTDLDMLYAKLHEMTDHIAAQADVGKKFFSGQNPEVLTGTLKLYVNDFSIGDNSNFVVCDDHRISYIIHNHINYLIITDPVFTSYHQACTQNIIKKSILISETGEKFRSRFFHLIHDRIEMWRHDKAQTLGKL